MTASTGKYARRGIGLAYLDEHISDDTDDCIEWPYGRGSHGYGITTVGHKTQRCVHVLACERIYGPPPTRMHEVMHSCDNRKCFNPRHLRWATRRENVQDMVSKGRQNFGGMNKGSKGSK